MLRDLLLKKRSALIKEWVSRTFDSYASETHRFLQHERDRFANPVGHVLSTGLEALFDEILREPGPLDRERLWPMLEDMVKVRSIQDFTSSQALAFLLYLKDIVRQEIHPDYSEYFEELLAFESRVDSLVLEAFEMYVICREKIQSITINELKKRTHMMQRMMSGDQNDAEERNLEEKERGNNK